MSFLGVASGGASHISTSLELSESSNETTSGSRWACWTGMLRGTSLVGTAVRSELLLEDVPSSRSDCVGSGCPAFLDVSTLLDCTGMSEKESEKEVVGVSMSLDCSLGASTVDRLVSGCSATGALAFLFPRSGLESEGFLNTESNVFGSLLLDVPLKTKYKYSKTV